MRDFMDPFAEDAPGAMVFLDITEEEALSGCTKTIAHKRRVRCARCNGIGAEPGTSYARCKTCEGEGQSTIQQGFFILHEICQACLGHGGEIETPCPDCEGAGLLTVDTETEVEVRAEAKVGTMLALRGKGNESRNPTNKAGDLPVALRIDGVFPGPPQETDATQSSRVPLMWALIILAAIVLFFVLAISLK